LTCATFTSVLAFLSLFVCELWTDTKQTNRSTNWGVLCDVVFYRQDVNTATRCKAKTKAKDLGFKGKVKPKILALRPRLRLNMAEAKHPNLI